MSSFDFSIIETSSKRYGYKNRSNRSNNIFDLAVPIEIAMNLNRNAKFIKLRGVIIGDAVSSKSCACLSRANSAFILYDENGKGISCLSPTCIFRTYLQGVNMDEIGINETNETSYTDEDSSSDYNPDTDSDNVSESDEESINSFISETVSQYSEDNTYAMDFKFVKSIVKNFI